MTGRFAPSPTGRMHLGNIFTALLAWLSVRSQGGRMLLRIEDLDPQRSRAAYAEQLRRDLGWLGLDWDGEMPPQSTRSPVYAAHFAKLEEQGLIYPCYCSRSELHDASAPHASDGTVLYSGACRDLTPEQRAAKTRGLDVGAIENIHKNLLRQRDAGKAVLLVSFDLEEVMNISDRIIVFYEGEIVADVRPEEVTVNELGLYMSGSKRKGAVK